MSKKSILFPESVITVITSVASGKQLSTPKVEFVFKGNGKRVNLNVLHKVTVQWVPKGSYALKHDLQFIKRIPA